MNLSCSCESNCPLDVGLALAVGAVAIFEPLND